MAASLTRWLRDLSASWRGLGRRQVDMLAASQRLTSSLPDINVGETFTGTSERTYQVKEILRQRGKPAWGVFAAEQVPGDACCAPYCRVMRLTP